MSRSAKFVHSAIKSVSKSVNWRHALTLMLAAGLLAQFGSLNAADHILDITWEIGANHPSYRKAGALGIIDGQIVSAAGQEHPWAESADTYSYNPVTNSWTTLEDMPVGRSYTDGVAVNNSLYVIGGRNNFATQEETYRLTHSGGNWNWETLPANLQEHRGYYNATTIGTKIYAVGGLQGTGTPPFTENSTLASVEVYDTAAPQNGWQLIPDMPMHSRAGASVAAAGGKLYVLGGLCYECNSQISARLRDGAVYDPATNSWTALPNLPAGLSNADTAVYNDRYIVLVGGAMPVNPDEVEDWQPPQPGYYNHTIQIYDTVNQTYRVMPTALPYGVADNRVVIQGNKIYSVGGEFWDASTNTTNWLQIGTFQTAPTSVLMRDGFETVPNATPYSYAEQFSGAQPSSESDPALTTGRAGRIVPGRWFAYDRSGTPDIDVQVTSNSTPGAASGDNYLRVHRGIGTGSAAIAAAFTEYEQPLTTGVLTASFQAQFPSTNPTAFSGGIGLVQWLNNDFSGGTWDSKAFMFVQDGGAVRHSFDMFGNNVFLGPSVIEDQWQQWTISADLDAQTYVLTIDGVSTTPQPFNYEGNAVAGLIFTGIEGAEFYVDDVEIEYFATAALPGDFNQDGNVDGRDFLLWQRDTSVGDLADWKANYGATSGLAATSAMPEPGTLALLGLAGIAGMIYRRTK